MRTGMKMTIQDYFKRSSVQSPVATCRYPNDAAAKTMEASFSQTLAAVQSSDNSQPERQGLSIRDYVARPVQAIRLLPSSIRAPKNGVQTLLDADDPSVNFVEPALTVRKTSHESENISEKDRIQNSIDEAAKRYNLPTSLIRAVVKAESNYQVRAVSSAGAQGLMQLMPATARELGVQNPFDIGQNIDGGAKYLRKMLDQFDGDIKIALSAYNAGPGTVSKFNGNVPYRETRNYVERVMRFSRQFS
jgi:soluble lytic murein transglycosylase-like protein